MKANESAFPRLSPTERRHLNEVLADLRKRRNIQINIAAKALERMMHKEQMIDEKAFHLIQVTEVTTPPVVRAFVKIEKALTLNKKQADLQAKRLTAEAEPRTAIPGAYETQAA